MKATRSRPTTVVRTALLFAMGVLSLDGAATAGDRKEATIVFNVSQRAFVCWFDGVPVPKSPANTEGAQSSPSDIPGCPYANAHPFVDNVHFYRGQRVSIRVVGGTLVDSYSVDLKVDDLVIPGIPVFGAPLELPSLQSISPTTRLVLTSGFTQAAARPDFIARTVYPNIDKAEPGEFAKQLNANIVEAADTPALRLLLGESVITLKKRLELLIGLPNRKKAPLLVAADAVKTDIGAAQRELEVFAAKYCKGPIAAAAPDLDDYLTAVWKYRQALQRQQALRTQVEKSWLPAAVDALGNLQRAATSAEVQHAINIQIGPFEDAQQSGVLAFLRDFSAVFQPGNSETTIRGLKIANADKREDRKYVTADGAEPDFLRQVNLNAVDPSEGAKSDNLETLKKNLRYVAQNMSALEAAANDIAEAQTAVHDLAECLNASAEGTFSFFNQLLDDTVQSAVLAAYAANCTAASMPLPDQLAIPLSDAWYGSKQVTVTLKRTTRLQLFDLGVVSQGASLSDPRGAAGGSSSSTASADDKKTQATAGQAEGGNGLAAETVGSAQFRVHDLYHFQLALGFMRSGVRDREYTLAKQTVKDNEGTETTNQMFVTSRDRTYRLLPTVDLLIYPIARDFFPRTARFRGETPAPWYTKLGALVGFSLSSPTTDFFFGGVYMTELGVGVKGGVHLGYTDRLPDGVVPNELIIGPATVVQQTLDHGLFFGFEMNAALFKDVFGLILKK